jgi:hypothetical protein
MARYTGTPVETTTMPNRERPGCCRNTVTVRMIVNNRVKAGTTG